MSESGLPPSKRNFIRAIEIWVPDPDHSRLVLQNGSYSDLDIFREFSETVSFAYGEGLPGLAWESGSPIVLNSLEDSVFQRTEKAHEAGLTSAIAFPIFSGEFLQSVILFFCGDREKLSGAMEIWKENENGELEIEDGYYGELSKFESLSKNLQLPKGVGLPGVVWETELPAMMSDLPSSSSFLRARYAAEAGIRTGIGIPSFTKSDQRTVVVFLSSHTTPIAERFEIWEPNPEHLHLTCRSAISRDLEVEESRSVAFGEGIIGGCWKKGIPQLVVGNNAGGFDSILAIPIIQNGRLNSVVVCCI